MLKLILGFLLGCNIREVLLILGAGSQDNTCLALDARGLDVMPSRSTIVCRAIGEDMFKKMEESHKRTWPRPGTRQIDTNR